MPRSILAIVLGLCVVASGLFFAASTGGQTIPKPPPPMSPKESMAKFAFPKDLEVEQLLTEPIVAQPIFVNFDERGRMWVVQYRQYPRPAGLKVVSRDKYWRVVYDKVPQPPPHHVRGADRITIHEDTTGSGVYDKHTTFQDGLNVVTAVVRGRGGMWVLNPPYLLFYPDKNNDDIPDGDPVVHLEGFGLEDTHSVVNSLCWGPDGWLYATQGSTVGAKVKRTGLDKEPISTSMGQHVWRYHPETRRFEIFAEGGGNAFGVEFDQKGRVYSGYNGANTRGFHYVQGGYYIKGFDKHGELSNPFAFGYFPAMKHAPVARFSHTFVIYQDQALPPAYRGHMFAINPLSGTVTNTEVTRDGSSFQTKDLDPALSSKDTWFRPVDIKVGPDGALYVCDFYDGHIAHLRHNEGLVDSGTGRIYRLKAKGAKASKLPDLGKMSSTELVKLLGEDDHRWQKQTALRLLGDRKDKSVIPLLTKTIRDSHGQLALEALWALNLSGGFDDAIALETLRHADPYVRLWTVRLLADPKKVSPAIAAALNELAQKEANVEVRSQLACSARRLAARDGLPVVRQLLAHKEDIDDVHVPLLLWWAIEASAESQRDEILKLFEDSEVWRSPLVQKHILSRLMRRFAQAGKQKDLLTCARLLRQAPEGEHVKLLLVGFEQGFAGRPVTNLPKELVDVLSARGGGSLTLRLRQNQPEAVTEALKTLADPKADAKIRLQLVAILGEIREPRSVASLLDLLQPPESDTLQRSALLALQPYNEPPIPTRILERYPKFSAEVRSAAQLILSSRAAWSKQLLQAIDTGKVDKDSIPPETVRKLLLHKDDAIQKLVRKHWGEVKGATTADMRKEIERLAGIVKSGNGDPYPGRKLFNNSCGKCHTMYGKGGDIGPDLTAAKRDDIDLMLVHIVNPSAEIREGYETYHVLTDDGRALLGFITEKDNQIVALRSSEGQTTVLPRDRIEDMRVVPQSLMPEGLLKGWTDEQVRDLFAYLRTAQPLNVKD